MVIGKINNVSPGVYFYYSKVTAPSDTFTVSVGQSHGPIPNPDWPALGIQQVVVFDAADLAAESSFWAGVLGGTVDAEADWHMVLVEGQPRIGVQLAPSHVRPDWPDGTPQQVHLDLAWCPGNTEAKT